MMSTPKGIDVVGLDNGSHGRNCTQHPICGQFVVETDKLYSRWAVQLFAEKKTPESCIQVYKLARDGHVGCHVGYLPRHLVMSSRDKDGGRSYDGLWLTVKKDLPESENLAECACSYHNHGIVYCHVAKDEWLVGKNPFEKCIEMPPEPPDDDDSKCTRSPCPEELRQSRATMDATAANQSDD
jgi:hypothetical protein